MVGVLWESIGCSVPHCPGAARGFAGGLLRAGQNQMAICSPSKAIKVQEGGDSEGGLRGGRGR